MNDTAKRIVGILLLIIALGFIFALTVMDLGLVKTLINWAVALIMAGLILLGVKLIVDSGW